MADAELVLLRHAQAGSSSLYWGLSDVELSAQGMLTAVAAAARLAVPGTPRVFSSPQRRAVQTATLVAARLGTAVAVDDRLAAKDYGSYTGMTKAQVRANRSPYSTPSEMWRWRPPGGESYADVALRVRDFLRDALRHAPDSVVVITHESTINVFDALCAGDLAAVTRGCAYGEERRYRLTDRLTETIGDDTRFELLAGTNAHGGG